MRTVALGLALLLQEPALPALTGRVVDAGNVLSPDEESRLTDRLETLECETSTQIVIATIPTLLGGSIEDYTFRLAESWQIGQSELDNGVVILVAVQDRRVRIEVGYGLEPVIPDGLAGRIIREPITPAFRRGDYYGGLNAAVEGLELAARKEYPTSPPQGKSGQARRAPPQSRPGVGFGGLVVTFLLSGIIGNAMGAFAAALLGAFCGLVFTGLAWWGIPLGALLGLFSMALFRGGPGSSGGGWTYHPTSGGSFRGGFGGGRLRWWWVRRRRFQRRWWRLWRRRRKWELVTCRFRGDFAVT